MKYSVVIPARNEEKYLEKHNCCVKKIPPSQVIVIDDDSMDKTFEIARASRIPMSTRTEQFWIKREKIIRRDLESIAFIQE